MEIFYAYTNKQSDLICMLDHSDVDIAISTYFEKFRHDQTISDIVYDNQFVYDQDVRSVQVWFTRSGVSYRLCERITETTVVKLGERYYMLTEFIYN